MNNLKYLRKKINLSTRALSSYTGISFSTISLLEKEQRPFRQSHIDRLTSFFNVSSDFLLGRSENGITIYPEFGNEPLLINLSEYEKLETKIEFSILSRKVTLSASFIGKDEETYCETPSFVYRELKGSFDDYELTSDYVSKIETALKKMDKDQLKKTYTFIEDYIL